MGLAEIAVELKELIANLGFPIFCAVILFREMEKERENHRAESEAWVEALNRNTAVIERLLEKADNKFN